MSDFVKSLARDFAQKAVGVVAVWLFAHTGIHAPSSVKDWAVLTLVGAGLFLWTGLVRALETTDGTTLLGGLAHKLARLLMLGIKVKPAYGKPTVTPRQYLYPQ